jgi:hypothetical protein
MTRQRQQRREGKEGNRWVNKPPTAEELVQWFKDNVEIDDSLDPADYVGGVTLIASKEKSAEVVGWDESNSPMIEDVWDLVYTPYIKVETRVKYFHDLMEANEGWLGIIEPAAPKEQDDRLPAGFFIMSTKTGEATEVRFICKSMKVTVYRKDTVAVESVLVNSNDGIYEWRRKGTVVMDPPAATKNVPMLNSYGKADTNAMMKAETGAVGRALGMAGMLVIPGTGLATAEDMQEAASIREDAGDPSSAILPEDVVPGGEPEKAALDADDALRKIVVECLKRMEVHPPTREEFNTWAKGRGFERLSAVTSPALRGMAKRAENMADQAEVRAAEVAAHSEGEPEESSEPEPTPEPTTDE